MTEPFTALARAARGSALAVLLAAGVQAQETVVSHGLSAFGDLKYPRDFPSFDYVDPNAPKGGTLRLRGIDSFDSLNPFILKGVAADYAGLVFESLMTRADDEPDAVYGLIAESAEMPADRAWVTFTIRPEARWSDGSPITAEDVVFSWRTLLEKGRPQLQVLYREFAGVEVLGPRKVKFRFRDGAPKRDLPLYAAKMPVLSKDYWQQRDFAASTLEPPLGSGPYRVEKVSPGRSITYQRVPDYWGRDLPVNRGRWNFDRIRVDYYRDRGIALEAFFAGEYDFREEFTSKSWAIGYDEKPAVRKGWIVRRTLDDATPSGVQAFFLNTRRKKFADIRVRRAFDLAFDFEWTNKNLFYGLYRRTTSMFENSAMAAKMPPGPAELALLEPLRGQVPEQVFSKPFRPAATDGSGNNRRNLRQAVKLLREAGWKIRGGTLTNAGGDVFEVEFLMFERSFERIIAPYIRNLERLGIKARMRIVDVANYQNRMRDFDFDITTQRYVQPLTPGVEQRGYWGSEFADRIGSRNLSGIRNPAVDALVEKVIEATSRNELVTAARALDRVLMWNQYVVPHWYKDVHTIAFWDKFAWPATKPKFARGVVDTWWVDAEKDRRLAEARGGRTE